MLYDKKRKLDAITVNGPVDYMRETYSFKSPMWIQKPNKTMATRR